MIFFVSASILGAAVAYGQSRLPGLGPPIVLSGFNGIGVLAGFVIFTLFAMMIGPVFGMALLIALLFHELGHVLAYQMLGHAEVRFRLVPILGNAPISDQPLGTEAQIVFVALMGAGFSLAPMVLAHLGALALGPGDPELARDLRIFAITCGAVNFVMLLPFWPLDGGRCAMIAARSIWPAFAPAITVFMTAAFAAAALRTGAVVFIILAGIGVASLFCRHKTRLPRLTGEAGLAALAAYAFTLAAHFSGGWQLISLYL